MTQELSKIPTTRSHHTVQPEVETLLSIQTEANAVCTLFHRESDHTMQLDADDNGIVRIHARPRKEWKPVEIHLEYTRADGKPVRHTLVLRGDTGHDGQISPNEVPSTAVKGNLRRPLEGDPLALSNAQLIERGYPRRPDPKQSPARYAHWLKNVTQSFTAVSPRRVVHPAVSFAPPSVMSPTLPLPPPLARHMFNANWSTWSGAYLSRPVKQFYSIYGQWNVPGVFALPYAPAYSAAAQWIGLDNSSTDLYQSGTDSECWDLGFFGWTFTNYWIWIESLPFAPWSIPNIQVSPGDSVSVDIFAADEYGNTWFENGSNGGLTSRDNSIWFMVYNNSRNQSYWGTLPTSAQNIDGYQSTPFTGSTAEFIIERPSVNGSAVPLASFMLSVMNGCGYADSNYGDMAWPLGADGSSPFDGSLEYLNMQNPSSKDLLDFTISVPDSTYSGGSEIIWFWTNYQ